jgi:hypothetical protein
MRSDTGLSIVRLADSGNLVETIGKFQDMTTTFAQNTNAVGLNIEMWAYQLNRLTNHKL